MIFLPDPHVKRIIWLILLLGILLGMWLIVIGVILFDIFAPFFSLSTPPFQIVVPSVKSLLIPFQFLLLGTGIILRWKVVALSLQRNAFRRELGRTQVQASFFQLTCGIGCLIHGCWILVNQAVSFPAFGILEWLEIGVLGICVGIGIFADLQSNRNTRPDLQDEQEKHLLYQRQTSDHVRK